MLKVLILATHICAISLASFSSSKAEEGVFRYLTVGNNCKVIGTRYDDHPIVLPSKVSTPYTFGVGVCPKQVPADGTRIVKVNEMDVRPYTVRLILGDGNKAFVKIKRFKTYFIQHRGS